jgi:hypothetical protein
MDISVLPSPLRRFLAQLEGVRSVGVLDMDQVGRVLVELAADEEYLGPLIAEMSSESPGGKWLSNQRGVLAWCCSTGPRG